jgi:hypothetical protein
MAASEVARLGTELERRYTRAAEADARIEELARELQTTRAKAAELGMPLDAQLRQQPGAQAAEAQAALAEKRPPPRRRRKGTRAKPRR